jgi:hypothetical protein
MEPVCLLLVHKNIYPEADEFSLHLHILLIMDNLNVPRLFTGFPNEIFPSDFLLNLNFLLSPRVLHMATHLILNLISLIISEV